jgi:hypothetical protein
MFRQRCFGNSVSAVSDILGSDVSAVMFRQ